MRQGDRRRAGPMAAGLLALAAAPAFVVVWWFVRSELPGRIPTHFDASGTPDGYSGASWFVPMLAVVILLLALPAVLALGREAHRARFVIAAFTGAAWLLTMAGVSVLVAARGVDDPTAAHLSMGWVLLAVGVGGAVGGAVWCLVGPDRTPSASTSAVEPPYTLGEHERAVWVGRASSTPLRVLAAALFVAGLVGWFFESWTVVAAVVPAAASVLWCSTITLRIDAGGLVAYYGPVAFPRMRVALDRVESAESVERIRPLEWGGWGFRVTPRGTGMIVRGGPAIVVHRSGRTDLAVSVDAPQQGVDLLRALQARVRAGN